MTIITILLALILLTLLCGREEINNAIAVVSCILLILATICIAGIIAYAAIYFWRITLPIAALMATSWFLTENKELIIKHTNRAFTSAHSLLRWQRLPKK